MKKSFVISWIIVAVGIAGISYYLYKQQLYRKEEVPAAVEITSVSQQSQELAQATQETAEIKLPPELNLKMTFYAQAPFGDWDYPWQEACEEASMLLIANAYYGHDWTREQFRDEILKLVDWQNERFGDYQHSNSAQNMLMLKEIFDLQSVEHKNPSYEDVQRILAKGHLIIGMFAGKQLGNPFYTNGGPPYHVLVIKGYKEGEKIITADVGTRRGEDYVFSWDTISGAMHDYAQPIEDGRKVIIEVIPPHF
jgi:hypothetical protein